MVQCCWLWLVWIIWQLVWTSTWQLGWKVGSTLRCRVVLPEVRHWKLVESYGLQTLCECHERRFGVPESSSQEKIAVLEKTLAGMGEEEPILAGKRVLEKELEKLQKKLNGPKKTAKHIESKQNWINKESKRLEAETARLTELQESLRARKETLKVAYEEIREDLLREGESMDKNKSHFLSPEDTEEIRILEQQELAFWRGLASKRLAGWTRDGSKEEIAGWMVEVHCERELCTRWSERELFTRSIWSNPGDSLIQMDFIMTSRKLDMKQVQVLDSDWFKTDHRAVLAVLSLRPKMRYTKGDGANLRGCEPDDSWHKVAAETLTE